MFVSFEQIVNAMLLLALCNIQPKVKPYSYL